MITLIQRDSTPLADNLGTLPLIPRDEDGPFFAEPWQAEAFALAVQLSAQGHFTWTEWASALSDELKGAMERGESGNARYYQCWLAALERLVMTKHLSDSSALMARKKAWAEAYRRTPHRKPVELQDESRP